MAKALVRHTARLSQLSVVSEGAESVATRESFVESRRTTWAKRGLDLDLYEGIRRRVELVLVAQSTGATSPNDHAKLAKCVQQQVLRQPAAKLIITAHRAREIMGGSTLDSLPRAERVQLHSSLTQVELFLQGNAATLDDESALAMETTSNFSKLFDDAVLKAALLDRLNSMRARIKRTVRWLNKHHPDHAAMEELNALAASSKNITSDSEYRHNDGFRDIRWLEDRSRDLFERYERVQEDLNATVEEAASLL